MDWNNLSEEIHQDNVKAGWWTDKDTGASLLGTTDGRWNRNVPEMLMLQVSELAEAVEGIAGDTMDDKLPHRVMFEVELADCAIRILDVGGAHCIDFNAIELAMVDYGIPRRAEWFTPYMDKSAAVMWIVGKIAEAMEGFRKSKADKRFPEFPAFHVGEAWALFACYALARTMGYDIDAAMEEKRAFNAIRPDHQLEARRADGGKAF